MPSLKEKIEAGAQRTTSGTAAPLDLGAIQNALQGQRGQRLWRCLEDVAQTPEYQALVEQEFPNSPERDAEVAREILNRRDALKLMAASVALAGLSGCTKLPTEKIMPYVKQPEDVIPGRPQFYATSMPHHGTGMGLLVESNLGRPTKVEGNPHHPASLGATDIFAQASVLSLYDPDRSKSVLREGRVSDWETFLAAINALQPELSARRGAGLHVVTECSSSPTLAAQMNAFQKQFPEARWHVHQPCGSFNSAAGVRLYLGSDASVVYRFDKASAVVSLDADFLDHGTTCVRYARDFANRRDIEHSGLEMNRLYVFESTPSNTGGMADHRFPVRCSDIQHVARALASRLGLPVHSGKSLLPDDLFNALVKDLQAHRGSSIVIAGESQPPYVHALACALNEALGNVEQTVFFTEPVEIGPRTDTLPELVANITAGNVSFLLLLGVNPVYTAPVDLQFAQNLLKVRLRVHLGAHEDETAALCNWHIPEAHYLESWGDTRAYDGTVGIVQPLIAPLYQGVTKLEMLAAFLGNPARPYDLVRGYWRGQHPEMSDPDFEKFWKQTLHDGVMEKTAFVPLSPKRQNNLGQLIPPQNEVATESIEIVFRPDPTIGDGRWANNGWLQELPKPFTKLTWDNALTLSPMTAWKLGVNGGDVVRIKNGPWEVVGPVWVMPGHADNSATMWLGYDRTRAGNVGSGFGLNGYLIRTSDRPDIAEGLKIEKTGRTHLMATTQMHHPIDRGGHQVEEQSLSAFHRDVVRIGTLEQFQKEPRFAADNLKEAGLSLYPPYRYEGYAWGMSIDLNRCTGCSACVMACYAENNIAVVGKYEVMAGRDMQWIRVDNYYRGDLKNPEMYVEPVPCMHCEQAPCELVCPVGATMHSSEGLNEMIYNRCVGTRYCSNNCPYKVRRFNFKLYSDWNTQSLYPLRNPDVTVRSRGVMEKCSYCVQRINEAKIRSEEENRHVRDGEIKTACQQVCPTQAIVFGNINDRQSEVSKRKSSPRDYSLLAELNTRPRTTYLAKLRNPNPDIAALPEQQASGAE
jgi:MoCo/4Fe-4S cofactor protein with predicted Tat translocation signal